MSDKTQSKHSATKENAKTGRKSGRRESTFANTHLSKDLSEIEGHRAQKALYRINLPFADCEDVRTRPGALDEQPTDVFVFLLFSRFRSVDIKGGGVNVRFFLSLQWDTGLSGFQIKHKELLWRPDIVILNNDNLIVSKSVLEFFPETGLARNILTLQGSIANEMSLRYFPWDIDRVSLEIVANIETGERDVRVFWQHSRKIESCTPDSLKDDLPEWKQDPSLNTIERLPPLGKFIGRYNGISFAFTISRHTGYYLTQVVLILCILTMLGWAAFGIYNDVKEIDDHSKLNSTKFPESESHHVEKHLIDNDILVSRLNHLMRVILACVAFQYVVRANLPKVHYMTTMDGIILCTTLNVFIIAVETVFLRQLHTLGYHAAVSWVDAVCRIFVPLSYVIPVFSMITIALIQRNSKRNSYRKSRWPMGVQPSLCIDQAHAVSDELTRTQKVKSVRQKTECRDSRSKSLKRLQTHVTYAKYNSISESRRPAQVVPLSATAEIDIDTFT